MAMMKQLVLEVQAPPALVVELAQPALQAVSATIEKVDADHGLILARKGVDLTSYGQVLRIWIAPVGETAARLTLQSELTAGFQIVDWGSNSGNLNGFTQQLTARLAERGYPAPVEVASLDPAPADLLPAGATMPPVAAAAGLAPGYSQPADFFRRPTKDRMIAIFLEIGFGLGGLPGLGWIYGGNTSTGIPLLVGMVLWDCLVVAIAAVTGGLSCLCTAPLNVVVAAFSAYRLSQYARAHPDVFSG